MRVRARECVNVREWCCLVCVRACLCESIVAFCACARVCVCENGVALCVCVCVCLADDWEMMARRLGGWMREIQERERESFGKHWSEQLARSGNLRE